MKIVKVYLGTKAVLAYYLAIFSVVILLSVIIYRILFMPSCIATTQNACTIDGGSIAGLAATVLGVGANVLAILGAFAVAVWWKDLNSKVEAQVDERTELRVNVISKNVEVALQTSMDQRLKALENSFKEKLLEMEEDNKRLWKEKHLLTGQIDALKSTINNERKMYLLGILCQEPWKIEQWADEFTTPIDPSSEIAFRMAKRYLQIVDALKDDTQKELQVLEKASAPSTDPLYYWNKSNKWYNKIEDNQQKEGFSRKTENSLEFIEGIRTARNTSSNQ